MKQTRFYKLFAGTLIRQKTQRRLSFCFALNLKLSCQKLCTELGPKLRSAFKIEQSKHVIISVDVDLIPITIQASGQQRKRSCSKDLFLNEAKLGKKFLLSLTARVAHLVAANAQLPTVKTNGSK